MYIYQKIDNVHCERPFTGSVLVLFWFHYLSMSHRTKESIVDIQNTTMSYHPSRYGKSEKKKQRNFVSKTKLNQWRRRTESLRFLIIFLQLDPKPPIIK